MHRRDDVQKILSWESSFLSDRTPIPARLTSDKDEVIGYMVELDNGCIACVEIGDIDQIERQLGSKIKSMNPVPPQAVS